MSPVYKLCYFNLRARAEFIRLLFAYGGIEFEDQRLNEDDWPEVKKSIPFGQVPLLEYNGKQVNQSVAIGRYVAKLVNLAGRDDWENLEIDAVVDTIADLRNKTVTIRFESDGARKKSLTEVAIKETIPFYLSRLEDIAKKNNGYLSLQRLTWADFFFLSTIERIQAALNQPSITDSYPTLKTLISTIYAIPSIKKWLEIRPKTDF